MEWTAEAMAAAAREAEATAAAATVEGMAAPRGHRAEREAGRSAMVGWLAS